jgi:hypothetical protein
VEEAGMNLIDRVKNILLSPASEWGKIKDETYTLADLFQRYAMILAAIPAVAALIGFSIVGFSYGPSTFRMPIGSGVAHCIFSYVFSLIGVYLMAVIIDQLSPYFGAGKDMDTALKIAVFSMTPAWVAGIFSIIPALSIIGMLAGFYGLYVLYLGIKQLKDAPADKEMTYFAAVVVSAVVINLILYAVVRAIFFRGPVI